MEAVCEEGDFILVPRNEEVGEGGREGGWGGRREKAGNGERVVCANQLAGGCRSESRWIVRLTSARASTHPACFYASFLYIFSLPSTSSNSHDAKAFSSLFGLGISRPSAHCVAE